MQISGANSRGFRPSSQSRDGASGVDASPRVIVVAANCSLRMGGEAAVPYHVFRMLRSRGVEVHLVAHERNRQELEEAFPDDRGRLHFVADDAFSVWAWQIGLRLPSRLARGTLGVLAGLVVQSRQRRVIRELILDHAIQVVHQCYPVSPAEPSMCYGLNVPVVIGPMNGGMDYPPGFRDREGRLERLVVQLGRSMRHAANRLIPGKREAEILLVANERTRRALPQGIRGNVLELAENGVELSLWSDAPDSRPHGKEDGDVRFVYVGRLVDWKGIDLLIEAWSRLAAGLGARLEVIGDGPLRPALMACRDRLGLSRTIEFSGYLPAEECAKRLARSDALVLPSLIECGGAVVLEAMASGLPVIATGWGGALDYLDSSCGVLVPPGSRNEFIEGLARAMELLTGSADLRKRMGEAARQRAASYSWEVKIGRLLEIYRQAVAIRSSTIKAARETGRAK